MPLLEGTRDAHPSAGAASSPVRRQSQLSDMAKSVIISSAGSSGTDDAPTSDHNEVSYKAATLMGPPGPVAGRNVVNQLHKETKPAPSQRFLNPTYGIGQALTDTPISTAPSSPQMQVSDSCPPRPDVLNISQPSSGQQNRHSKNPRNYSRYSWPHKIKGFSRRKDRPERCRQ